VHPADLDEARHLDAARVTEEQERGIRLLLPDERGIARVHAGRERLDEQGVSVVPDRDEPEAGGRRVHRRAVANDDARVRPRGVEEGAVAIAARLARIGAQHPPGIDGCRERGLELGLVAVVGHDEDRRAICGEGVRGRLREGRGPRADPLPRWQSHRARVGGERHPLTAFDAGLDATGLTAGDRRQVAGQRSGIGLGRAPRTLDADVSARDGHPEDVARIAGGAVGRGAGELPDLGSEQRHVGDDVFELAQRATELARPDELDEPAVGDAAARAERHAHAHARRGRAREPLGHRVVEQLVELRQRRIDEHPGDGAARHVRDRRQRGGRRRGRAAPR
jgi:hypothetical protein